jgi:hypothetical protein
MAENIKMIGNIKEDYVSFELAKALHENGCLGEHEWAYDVETKEVVMDDKFYHKDFDKVEVYAMPTLNVARKWVQATYNCFISVEQKNDYLSQEICTYYTYNITRFDVFLGSGMESVYTSPFYFKKETDAIEHAIFYLFSKEKNKK